MGRLLGDLLDITRIEQRRLSVHMEPMDLAALTHETVSMHTPVAQARSIRLDLAPPPPKPVVIHADPSRLIQALSNLMDNALKFTPAGGEVVIIVERRNGAVAVSVTDSGPGIPGEQIPHLFDRFWRSDAHSRTGLGLGLCIAKGIIDAHGGRIDVASTLGRGSSFTMVLPENQSVK
jgi:signal transduction histidine kinase